MSSTDSTELEDYNCQEYLKEEIERQNFSQVLGFVESIRAEGKRMYLDWLKVIYEHSVSLYCFEFAESLFKLYPELLTHEHFLDPFNITELSIAASVGQLGFMRFLLNVVGIAPTNKGSKGAHLFECAAVNNQLETCKFIRDELGISSSREELIHSAMKFGHETMVQYLHEEVGIEVRRQYKCILNAIKSGSLPIIQYLYQHMGIRAIDDVAIVELAVYQASKSGSTEILEELLNFEFKMRVNMIQPYNEINDYSYPLCFSMVEAANRGHLKVIQFVHEVLKVELATDSPSSSLACYVQMLKCAVEGAHKAMLAYLLDEVHLDATLMPSQQNESLISIVLNCDVDEVAKLSMLRIVTPHESNDNYAKAIEQATDEQRLLIGRMKRKSRLSKGGPHKIPKTKVFS